LLASRWQVPWSSSCSAGARSTSPGPSSASGIAQATIPVPQRGAISAAVALSAIALWGTTRGTGPFTLPQRNDSLLLQLFVNVITISNLVLGAVVSSGAGFRRLGASELSERTRAARLEAVMSGSGRDLDRQRPGGSSVTGNRAANS
jgi:hypothetical protein